MAEINIQRKERSAWPWLLAGVVLLALLWFLFARGSATDNVATRADSALGDTGAAAGTLDMRADSLRADTLRRPPAPR